MTVRRSRRGSNARGCRPVPLGLHATFTHALQYPTAPCTVFLQIDLAALEGVGQRLQTAVGVLFPAAHFSSLNTRKPTSGCAAPASARCACTVQSDQKLA